ncbi:MULTISPECIES: hypothetical protein [unclassified Caballeronia]|uniref:hypothetical protein n=1 Tax=unclassified Caballeronia TaxID=2646786 RepID=UPI002027B700|nr:MULTISPECIES: hypothetical protein [unclassified Caballeronia]
MSLSANFDPVGDDYRLCFVRVPWAFFTRVALDRQWGEHWDQAPYELHAGLPDSSRIHPILKVAFDGPFFPPDAGRNGHSLSVRELNEGAAPWLRTEGNFHGEPVHIMAGVTLRQFHLLVSMAGGTLYAPIDWGELPKGRDLTTAHGA